MLLSATGCLLIWLFVNLKTLLDKQGLKRSYEPMGRASFSVCCLRIDEGYVVCSFPNIFIALEGRRTRLKVHCVMKAVARNAKPSALALTARDHVPSDLIDFGVMHMNDNGWTMIEGM